MALFSDSELLMIAVILDEEEHKEKQTYKKKINACGSIKHGRREQRKENFPLYIKS